MKKFLSAAIVAILCGCGFRLYAKREQYAVRSASVSLQICAAGCSRSITPGGPVSKALGVRCHLNLSGHQCQDYTPIQFFPPKQ